MSEPTKIVIKRRVADVRMFQNDVLVAVLGRDRRGVHRLHHTRESSPDLIRQIEKFVKDNTNDLGLFTAFGECELD